MAFLGFDHIDTRVRSVKSVEPFYDRLLPALGLTEKNYAFVDQQGDWHEAEAGRYNAVEYHEPAQPGRAAFFIGFIEDAAMQPVGTRIAFRVAASELGHWHEDLRGMQARNIELSAEPDDYPAIFFEDPAGTKLELVARKPRR
jgi:hypothetical protein